MTVVVYFLLDDGLGKGGTLVPVSRELDATPRVADATLRELLKGPSPDQITEGTDGASPSSLIPPNTFLLGLTLVDGVATVDLTKEFEAGAESSVMARRLAQLVYTLTQFRTITGVLLKLDGNLVPMSSGDGHPLDGPATRNDYLDLLPPIFVDDPAWGGTVGRPIVIHGRANVFEAAFQLKVTDDNGRLVDRRKVMATCGTGCWGDWQVEIDVTNVATERLWVMVWVPSEVDGTPTSVRRFPILLPPAG
jgi:germination protein M